MSSFVPIKLKYMADHIGRGEAPCYLEEDGTPVINQACVWPQELRMERVKWHDPEQCEQITSWIHAGDVLVNSTGTGTLGRAGFVAEEPNQPVFADGHVTILRDTQRRYEPRFLFYALSIKQEELTVECSDGATNQIELNRSKLGSFLVGWPPLEQQRAIADHLDRETRRIDNLIAAKERWLALLAEKRTAIAEQIVTRGVKPAVALKRSGIEWLMQIPKHWAAKKVAYLFQDRDERGSPDLPLLEVSIQNGVTVREFSDEHIETMAADFNTYKVARAGDIAFNKMRMWQGAVGAVPEDGLISPDYTVAQPTGEILTDYAATLFRSPVFSAECARHSNGIVWDRLRLYWDGFRDIRLPVPPLSEQRAIVAHIREETAKLDALRVATERSLTLLRERRAALVAEAVTGKLSLA